MGLRCLRFRSGASVGGARGEWRAEHLAVWVAGQQAIGITMFQVRSPADGRVVGTVCEASPDQIEEAVAAAAAAAAPLAALPAHRRAAALAHVSDCIAARAEELAAVICAENGKPITWARAEVTRAALTFRWAAGEARRVRLTPPGGSTPTRGEGRLAVVRRFPRGPVLGISPFNFPLNLVAHKVAPALAVGAPIVMKPAPKTPLSALLLGKLLSETDLPSGSWSVLTVPNAALPELVADPRLPVVSFTGSGPVGWQIRAAVPTKHVTLELGATPQSWSPPTGRSRQTFGGPPNESPALRLIRPASPAYPSSASTPTRACVTRCCPR